MAKNTTPKDKFAGCVTETYFDKDMNCDVTVILDTSERLSPSRKLANAKAKERGFQDIDHFEGFLYANSLYTDLKPGSDVEL